MAVSSYAAAGPLGSKTPYRDRGLDNRPELPTGRPGSGPEQGLLEAVRADSSRRRVEEPDAAGQLPVRPGHAAPRRLVAERARVAVAIVLRHGLERAELADVDRRPCARRSAAPGPAGRGCRPVAAASSSRRPASRHLRWARRAGPSTTRRSSGAPPRRAWRDRRGLARRAGSGMVHGRYVRLAAGVDSANAQGALREALSGPEPGLTLRQQLVSDSSGREIGGSLTQDPRPAADPALVPGGPPSLAPCSPKSARRSCSAHADAP